MQIFKLHCNFEEYKCTKMSRKVLNLPGVIHISLSHYMSLKPLVVLKNKPQFFT